MYLKKARHMGNNISEINSSDTKSCFVNFEKLTVSYINKEGNEIVIQNECQLQEAMRVIGNSYWSSNLKLLFCQKDAKTNNQQFVTEAKMSQTWNAKSEENSCLFSRNSPPAWFSFYMQKFREELMDEVKSSIHKAVFDASNTLKTKQEVASSLDQKNESASSIKTRRKSKKITDKYVMDMMAKKLSNLAVETSMLKKIEKFHSRRLNSLELRVESKLRKLDKMVEQAEGKRKLVEKKQQSTSTEGEKSEKPLSAIFLRNNLSLEVLGTSTFSLNISVTNNGVNTWKCNELRSVNYINSGVVLDQPVILLPPLKPMETHAVMLTGRVVSDAMFYVLQMRVFAGLEPVSPLFTCWVDVRHARFDCPPIVGGSKTQTEARTDISVDFDKHVVANTQKKIEENITEIEKMLRDIDLLRTTGENSSGKDDLVGHAKEKDSRVKLLGKECSSVMNSAEDNQEDEEEKEGKLTRDSNSDSDLSIICVSEEEENFVVIPSPSQSPIYCPVNEEENHRVAEGVFVNKISIHTVPPIVEESTKLENNKREQKGEVSLVCPSLKSKIVPLSEEIPEENHRVAEGVFVNKISNRTIPPVVEELTKLESNESEVKGEMKCEREVSPPGHTTTTTKSRKAPFREEIPQSKSKKMKSSKRTEYSFPEPSTSAQSAFSPQTDGPFEWRPTTFTFTGEKEAKKETSETKVPVRDSIGRVIYAVHRKGYCQPVETILRSKERENSEEKRIERESETPAINILPNALMNGASNVASLALNTAKSVINNLQSAFVKDGVSGHRVGDAGTMEESASMKYLLCLYEMGFSDLNLNRKLLRLYNNNIEKVVEELVYSNMVYSEEEE